jgi:PAS domain S-box-containing protein
MKKRPSQPAGASRLRLRAEARLREQQGNRRSSAGELGTAEDTARLVHELQVHQVELEMQTEELLQANAKIKDLLDQYTNGYDFGPAGCFTLDAEGAIRMVNLAGARLLGVERSKLVTQRFGQFVAEDHRRPFGHFLKKVFMSEAKERCESTVSQASGAPLVVQIEGIRSADGQECRAVVWDITEPKRLVEERELTLRLLDQINASTDLRELMRAVTRLLRDSTGCEAVGIRLRDGEDFPYFETSGFPEVFVQAESQLCARDVHGKLLRDPQGNAVLECMCGTILCGRFDPAKPFFTARGSFWTNGTTQLLASTTDADRNARTRNRCNREGYESVALIRIRTGGETFGLLQFNDKRPGRFTPEMIALLERLADHLASALAREQAHEALNKSEARYRAVVEDQTELICRFRKDGTFIVVNDAYCRFFGKRHEELIGKSWQPMVVAEDLPMIGEKIRLLTPSTPVAVIENRVYSGSGQVHWMQFVNRGFFDPQGQLTEIQAVGRDITKRKDAEEALRKSQRLLSETEGIGKVGGWEFNIDTGKLTWTEEVYHIHEVDSTYEPTVEQGIRFYSPTSRPMIERAVQRAVEQGEPFDLELEMVTARGNLRSVHAIGKADVQTRRVYGFFQDITALKEAQKRMQMFSQEILAAREEERKRVSAALHHDVGSMAVGLGAHLDVIEAQLRSGKPGKALRWTKQARKQLGKSVMRLKEVAVQVRPPELDLLGLRAALRQHIAQITKLGGLRVQFRETLGRKRVGGEVATMLFRVAQEALTNAIKHGHAKQVKVELLASKTEISLIVSDHGKGFNPAKPGKRATALMGLRVMREMAASVGGVCTIDAALGKGTIVRVRLPWKGADA